MPRLPLTYDGEQLRFPGTSLEDTGESWQVGETYPTCPQCNTNYSVYCMDCETHSLSCSCWTVEFYCGDCNIDFAWSSEPEDMELVLGLHKELLREKRIEDVLNDADEILDVKVMPVANPYTDRDGALTLVRTVTCNECGEQDIKHTHHRHDWNTSRCGDGCFVWAPLKELTESAKESYIINPETDCPNCFRSTEHECVDPNTGEIYYWTVKDTLKCTCTPEKIYICSPCNVYRMTPDHPWMSRDSLDKENHVAEFIAAQMGGGDVDYDYEGPKPECKCEHEPAYFCGACRVARNTPNSEWYALDGYTEAQAAQRNRKSLEATKKASNSSKTPYSGSTSSYNQYEYDSWDDDYRWTGMYKCRHYGQEVELLDGTRVYCSSLWDTRKDEKDHPDRGLYFDWSWKPDWRSELSHWPDFGCPTNLKATAEAIKDHYEFAKQGLKVDLGCIGGHGRTGTALACMYILSGAKPGEAGQLVRKQYCNEAIESKIQVWYLTWFDAYIHDRPLPEKPVYQNTISKATGTGISSGTTSYCSIAEHYTQWLANPDSVRCTKRKNECTKFTSDFKDFVDGKVDNYIVKNALDIKNVSDYNNIDGYLVPKSKAGERSHVKTDANCTCDYCRYTSKGYGAFLDPAGVDSVYIQTPTGIVKTDVTADFKPQPPREPGVDLGDTNGEYVWLDFESEMVWVWDAIKYAKQKYMKANVERNKAAREAAKAASAAKAETSTALAEISDDTARLNRQMRDLKNMLAVDGKKIHSKTKRNKKNASRNNGRRRHGRRRR